MGYRPDKDGNLEPWEPKGMKWAWLTEDSYYSNWIRMAWWGRVFR